MSLDLAISRTLAVAALLERALHSSAPWFIEIGTVRVRAVRHVHDSGVMFTACYESAPADADSVVLYEGDEMVSARPFSDSGEGEFCIEWKLNIAERVST
jgi:hypothetical protein